MLNLINYVEELYGYDRTNPDSVTAPYRITLVDGTVYLATAMLGAQYETEQVPVEGQDYDGDGQVETVLSAMTTNEIAIAFMTADGASKFNHVVYVPMDQVRTISVDYTERAS